MFEKSLATILEDSENYSWGICNEFTLFSRHKLPQSDLVYLGYFHMLESFFSSIVFADVSRRDFLHSLNWHVLKLHVKPRLRRLRVILQVVVTAALRFLWCRFCTSLWLIVVSVTVRLKPLQVPRHCTTKYFTAQSTLRALGCVLTCINTLVLAS